MNPVKKEPPGNGTRHQQPNLVRGCLLTAALAAVGGKWKLIIVYWLAESPRYFAALRRAMPGISQKVLTQQLREMVSDGIVQRQPKGEIPAPVVYSLTDYGRSLLPTERIAGQTFLNSQAHQSEMPPYGRCPKVAYPQPEARAFAARARDYSEYRSPARIRHAQVLDALVLDASVRILHRTVRCLG